MNSHMQEPRPIYTEANCRPAYALRWSLAIFWRESFLNSEWLAELSDAVEKDGVRILSLRHQGSSTSQFLVSTRPQSAPKDIVRSVKGRLQHIIRGQRPKAFRRNYSIYSVGSVKRKEIEEYVSSQLDHHSMADPNVQEKLCRFQINRPEVDLAVVNRSAHGQYIHNLHLVLVNAGRWCEIAHEALEAVRLTLLKASEKKGHRLSYAGIFANHLHMTLGCDIGESPSAVALGYLNNLAYAQGMRPIYQFGYYVGTFGEYDLGAVK